MQVQSRRQRGCATTAAGQTRPRRRGRCTMAGQIYDHGRDADALVGLWGRRTVAAARQMHGDGDGAGIGSRVWGRYTTMAVGQIRGATGRGALTGWRSITAVRCKIGGVAARQGWGSFAAGSQGCCKRGAAAGRRGVHDGCTRCWGRWLQVPAAGWRGKCTTTVQVDSQDSGQVHAHDGRAGARAGRRGTMHGRLGRLYYALGIRLGRFF